MRKKRIAAMLLCAFAFALLPCGVWAEELLVGGQTVGIEISAEGVIVSGFSRVETEEGELSPAEEAGFLPGDLIVKLNGQPIRTAEDLIGAVAQLGGDEAAVDVRRGERTAQLKVRPALSPNGQWLLGLWLRDGVSGVGTLTFVEPESGLFGALGHSVLYLTGAGESRIWSNSAPALSPPRWLLEGLREAHGHLPRPPRRDRKSVV